LGLLHEFDHSSLTARKCVYHVIIIQLFGTLVFDPKKSKTDKPPVNRRPKISFFIIFNFEKERFALASVTGRVENS